MNSLTLRIFERGKAIIKSPKLQGLPTQTCNIIYAMIILKS